MKKLLVYGLLCFSFLALNTSCGSDDDESDNEYVNKWIKEQMDDWYLWNDQMPSQLNYSANPEDFFESLLYKRNQKDGDRFSWIQDNFIDLLNSSAGITKEAGYDYTPIRIDGDGVIGFVTYIKPNSPATQTALKRGNIITAINGKNLTISNYQELFGQIYQNHTLTLAKMEGKTLVPAGTLSMSVSVYEENPVFLSTMFGINGKKIGYIVYNFFTPDPGDNSAKYELELNTIMAGFKSAKVDDVIIDLRYNGGGRISTAVTLGSMLVKNLSSSRIFLKSTYNSYLMDLFTSNGYDLNDYFTAYVKVGNYNKEGINNLNLNRVYLITSYRTASASELIINGLKPFMDVYIIGEKTTGKNVGSLSLYEEDDNRNKWGMQPLICFLQNSEGFSDYTDGFPANVEVDEYGDFTDIKPLGNPDEIMLKAALEYVVNGSVARVQKSVNVPLRQNLSMPQHDRGIVIDNKPALFEKH